MKQLTLQEVHDLEVGDKLLIELFHKGNSIFKKYVTIVGEFLHGYIFEDNFGNIFKIRTGRKTIQIEIDGFGLYGCEIGSYVCECFIGRFKLFFI